MNELDSGYVLQGSKYQIIKKLGSGGFGITYKGLQTGLNRKVAIKEFFIGNLCMRATDGSSKIIFFPQSEHVVIRYKEKFYREARTIAKLVHKHIVKVIDVFYENNTAYYIMEYIPGGSVYDYVNKYGPFSEQYAWKIINQIGSALNFVHKHHFLHLDVKPENILFRTKDDAVLIDFGISKQYSDEGYQLTTMPVGLTRGYAPLEQYKENGVSVFTPATDVYSLGATMYFMLTGIRPPEPQDIIRYGMPSFPGTVSLKTQQAVSAALQPFINNRLQNVTDFLLWQEVEKVQTSDETHNMRYIIELLIKQKNYKEAYNRCVDCINRGIDLEYSHEKCKTLLPIIRKKANLRNTVMYSIAFLIIVLSIIFTVIASIFN